MMVVGAFRYQRIAHTKMDRHLCGQPYAPIPGVLTYDPCPMGLPTTLTVARVPQQLHVCMKRCSDYKGAGLSVAQLAFALCLRPILQSLWQEFHQKVAKLKAGNQALGLQIAQSRSCSYTWSLRTGEEGRQTQLQIETDIDTDMHRDIHTRKSSWTRTWK